MNNGNEQTSLLRLSVQLEKALAHIDQAEHTYIRTIKTETWQNLEIRSKCQLLDIFLQLSFQVPSDIQQMTFNFEE